MLNPDPEKFAALPEAFNALGRNRFGEKWTGTELAARNLAPPKDTFRALKDTDIARARAHQELAHERRMKADRAKKAAVSVGGGVRISRRPRNRPPTPEAEARARRDKVEIELRKLLHGKRIPTTLLNDHDGKLVGIPPAHWLADKFTVDFASGQAEWADLQEGQRVTYQGVVLIDRLEFDRVVMNTRPLKSKPSKVPRRGRKKGSGSLASKDAPMLELMKPLIADGKSYWPAAMEVAPQAAGHGTVESRAKRLVARFKEWEQEHLV